MSCDWKIGQLSQMTNSQSEYSSLSHKSRAFKSQCEHTLTCIFFLPLYSGGEVWEGIWNQTHLVVCIEFLSREITPRYHTTRYGMLKPYYIKLELYLNLHSSQDGEMFFKWKEAMVYHSFHKKNVRVIWV